MPTLDEALHVANQFCAANRLDEAKQIYTQVLACEPNHLEALLGLGQLMHKENDCNTAEKLFHTAVQFHPNSVKVWFTLGNLYFSLNQLPDAEVSYRHALELQPQTFVIHHNLVYTLQIVDNKLNRLLKACKENQLSRPSQRLKVAFVNQYCDTLLPPKQNSVGACTYGIARPLAEYNEVLAYTLDFSSETGYCHKNQGVQYHFIAPSEVDIKLFQLFYENGYYLKIFNRGSIPPAFIFRWIFPFYGRAIAKDLISQNCDIVHFQHTTSRLRKLKCDNI